MQTQLGRNLAIRIVSPVIRGEGWIMRIVRRRPTFAPEDIPTLAEVERLHILQTLAMCGYNRTHAAKLLGLSLRCLRLKLHEYELSDLVYEPPPPKLNDPH